MKSIRVSWWLAISLVLVLVRPVFAEEIISFDAQFEVLPSGDVRVRESIVYDFGDESRHGIYRNLPTRYEREGADEIVPIDVEAVEGPGDEPWEYDVEQTEDGVQIRIGSADETVTGQQTYVISYVVEEVIREYDGQAEFYWNVNGTQWDVAATQVAAEVSLPDAAGTPQVKCFTGAQGETKSVCSASAGSRSARFSAGPLKSSEGLTIVVGFSPEAVPGPDGAARIMRSVSRNGHWLPGIFTGIFTFLAWFWKGRDPRSGRPVVTQYRPPAGLSPAAASVVWRERVGSQGTIAALLDLAARGHVLLREDASNNWSIERTARGKDELSPLDQSLLSAFLGTRDSISLGAPSDSVASALPRWRAEAEAVAVKSGAFLVAPETVVGRYVLLGVAALIGAGIAVGVGFVPGQWGTLQKLALFIPGSIIIASAWAMPVRTVRGTEIRRELAGLHEFISRVHRDDLDKVGADRMAAFEQILPYAIVLDCAEPWTRAFEGVLTEPPSWFISYNTLSYFDAGAFHSRLVGFESSTELSMRAPSSSSGGGSSGFSSGSSGGGYGGGGGGSW